MSAIAQTPILGAAFGKCAAVMKGDAGKRLADAVAKISRLRERLAEIEREISEHSKRFSRYTAEKKAQFDASKSFEDERQHVLAQVIESWVREHATTSAAEQAAAIYGYGVPQTAAGDAFAKLASEVPGWRETLETALKAKAGIAEQALTEIEATVTAQLSGFSDEDVQNDPRLKRARKESVRWRQLVKQFADAKDLDAWRIGVDALFLK